MSASPVAQEIYQLLSEGNYQQALQLAQQNGLTQTAQEIQALIYVQQAIDDAENGNIDQALTDLQNAQKLDPNLNLQPYFAYLNVIQLFDSANEALQNDDYNTALNDLQQALQIAQQYPNVINVTQIQQQIQTVQALQQIEQYINEANSELEKANFAQAYQYLQQAQQLAQQYNISNNNLENVTTAVSYLAKIPPIPQPPKGKLTLQELQQYLQELQSFFATASQYATQASRYYSRFSVLANDYQQSEQVSSQLLSIVTLLVNAQNTAEQNSNSVPAIQNSINLIQQAQNQLQNVNAEGTPLAGLANSLSETVQEMYTTYTAYLQILEDIDNAQQEAENGNYSEAVQYLQQASQIAQQNNINIDLTKYIQGFTILEDLQPLPKPPSTQTFLSLSEYFDQVYQVLQQNYQVLEKASKYLQLNLQSVQGDIQDAKNISQAMQLLAEAQFLLSPSPSNNPLFSKIVNKIPRKKGKTNTSIISTILANKDTILNYISQALQLLTESESYDMKSTAQQLFEIAQKYQTQVQIYLAGLEETQQALDALNTVNALVTQQPNANSPSAYFLALQNNYTEALRVLKNAMSSAMEANSLFEQINATPPFNISQFENEGNMLQQFIQLFGTTASAYSAIENTLNSQNNLSTPSSYAKYYQNVASTIHDAIQEINSLSISDNNVDQVRRQIVKSLQQNETNYLALSHAFNIIASATLEPVQYSRRPSMANIGGSINQLQALAQAYSQASQYLSQYPSLQPIAQQFANLSEFYTLIDQANELLQQAQASSSISTEISLMEQAKGYLQQALQYIPSNSQAYQEIQNEISNINKAISTLQNAQSLVQQINNAINNGESDPQEYFSALYYYNELLQETQGININNVVNDVSQNNYFQAIQDVNNNPSLQPQQKQFLTSLVATIGITTYYLPQMNHSLQQAQSQASSLQLSNIFNFAEQMQPIANDLQNALQYAQDAENLAQYVSPQLQQNLSQVVSEIQEKYNAVEEQIQKAESNSILNGFEGFVNTFNTAINDLMNDINNLIYSAFGKNIFTEILAGIVDGAIFIAISAIPIVGEVFDILSFISFVGSTAFDLLAGSASFNETVSSFEQMFTNPTSLSTIVTLITAVLTRKLIAPDDIESVDLADTTDSVKSVLSKLEDSIKNNANVSTINDKVTGTIQSSVTESPDFSKINDLVKEVNLDKLDIKALKGLGNKIVKIEGDAYEFVESDISDTKITTTTYHILKDVRLKVFDGVGDITVKLSKAFPKDIEANVKPELINDIVAKFENGKLEFTRIDENTLKNRLFLNFTEALDTIELNLSATVARQLFDALKKADGNVVRISPNEDIAYFGGKFYDIVFKDGKVVKMEIINGTMAYAKLVKFAEDAVGKFITLNKDLIEQLLKSSKNLRSIEYELTNKLIGNVVRNEYLKLKDALGNETTLTSKTMINPNEIETVNVISGKNLPEISENAGFLTPQELNDLLSFDNRFSQIFKPLIDEHPEVRDLLERLAFEGKLPASFRQLEEIADNIKSFYDALDKEVKDIENKLSSNPLFNGVDVASVIKTIARQIVKNDPYDILDGEAPKISLWYVIKHLSTSDKAKVVLNYLKTDPEVYDEVMKKLSNFSADTRDYILAEVYDRIVIGVKGDEPIIAGDLEYVVEKIDNIINNISSKGSKTPVSTSTTNTTVNGTTSTTNAGGAVSNTTTNGTSTVLQPPIQQGGILKRISLNTMLENALSGLFPDFDKLPPAVKTLFEDVVFRQLKEEGELTKEDLMKALEEAKAEYQAILDSIKKLVDDVKAETTSSKEEESVVETLDTSIGELQKKLQFDLKKLLYFLSVVSFVADKFNVATAIELINQLNSLTPQQLQKTIILTQPQLETIAKIAPLLKELIVNLDNGVKPKDLQSLATKIREALEKMEINLDVEQLIRIINVLQTMTKEFNLKISEVATLITEEDVNNLRVIPIPVISNLNLKSLIMPTQPVTNPPNGTTLPGIEEEEIPETTLSVGEIPLQGEALQQLQQLLSTPTATPPSINEEGGSQGGGGGVTVPPSYSSQQFASYRSKQQYLII
jgi:tetratricopeptide (TPR) repeat protein